MRKLFRMKYEACNGQCYDHSDVMRIHTLGLDEQGAAAFLQRLVQIHGPACGNASLGFRLDVDERLGIFVASFERYGALDLFADTSPKGALDQLIDAALAYYETDEYKAAAANAVEHHPGCGQRIAHTLPCDCGARAAVCHHGDDRKLIDFAITFSGLDDAAQGRLRARFTAAA